LLGYGWIVGPEPVRFFVSGNPLPGKTFIGSARLSLGRVPVSWFLFSAGLPDAG